MKVIRCIVIALAAVLVGSTVVGHAQAELHVVGDGACPRHAVDDAAFATCDGEHVARADGVAFLAPESVSHMKALHGAEMLLIDVRSRAEAQARGMATQVDVLVPYATSEDGERQAQFLARVRGAVAARGGTEEMPIALLCRDGALALLAAEQLAAAGHRHVVVVDGGFEGRQHTDGRVRGWKESQLPWSADLGSGQFDLALR